MYTPTCDENNPCGGFSIFPPAVAGYEFVMDENCNVMNVVRNPRNGKYYQVNYTVEEFCAVPVYEEYYTGPAGCDLKVTGATNLEYVEMPGMLCQQGQLKYRSSPISLIWENGFNVENAYTLTRFPMDTQRPKGQQYEWRASDKAPLLVFDPGNC